jgi:hypothetical protein
MEEYQTLQHPLIVEERRERKRARVHAGAGKRWEGEREKETCVCYSLYSSKNISENVYTRSLPSAARGRERTQQNPYFLSNVLLLLPQQDTGSH